MMLGEVIGVVESPFFPVNVELALPDAVPDPIEAHIDGFGATLLDGVVGDAGCGAVVGDNGCGWLWVPKFGKGGANGAGLFAVVEEGC